MFCVYICVSVHIIFKKERKKERKKEWKVGSLIFFVIIFKERKILNWERKKLYFAKSEERLKENKQVN